MFYRDAMMAMRLDFFANRHGNFSVAACLLAVPVLMGVALSIDYGRIDRARGAARSALQTAVSVSGNPDGEIDAGLAREIYQSILKLPGSQSSTPPIFYLGADGKRMAAVRTATRLTLGGVLLPKNYYSVIVIPARAAPAVPEPASRPLG
jgi:hypothetical protein